MSKYIDLKGKRFGKLVAKEFLGGPYGEWLCKCDCDNEYKVRGKFLRNGYITECNLCRSKHTKSNEFIDLTGQQFGQWKVIGYKGNSIWNCECSCGRTTKDITSTLLKTHQTTMCEKCRNDSKVQLPKYDMTNEIIGNVQVVKYIGSGVWECKCKCNKIINVKGFNLRKAKEENKNYACEECSAELRREDLTNKTFGMWHVDSYVGNGHYQCTCGCENKTVKRVEAKSLKSGASTSCGCGIREKMMNTKLARYGDITVNTTNKNRTQEQILACANIEDLKAFITNNFEDKPTLTQLADALGIKPVATGRKIHKFGLENLINYISNVSNAELKVREVVRSLWKGEIQFNVKHIISTYELDIYIPDKKLAIEFNGNYWHSTIYKNKKYHQDKTITCAKFGIRLIHIFEYEWENEDTKIKIISMLRNILSDNLETVYARDCKVEQVNYSEIKDFINRYHLQGYANSNINIALKYDNEVVGAMTFSNARFNNTQDYEVIRLVYRDDIRLVGGTEKMFKYLVRNYNPQSILTYVDISKFTGNSYSKLGFKSNLSMLTEPSYVWVNNNNKVLSRYQTQKKNLIKQCLGTENQTEDEIMEELGYLKVYNSGNLKLIWTK